VSKSSDHEKDTHEVMNSIKAREIVSEILNFGVNQTQLKKIIRFLSLELEDRSLMVDISTLLDSNTQNNTITPKIEI